MSISASNVSEHLHSQFDRDLVWSLGRTLWFSLCRLQLQMSRENTLSRGKFIFWRLKDLEFFKRNYNAKRFSHGHKNVHWHNVSNLSETSALRRHQLLFPILGHQLHITIIKPELTRWMRYAIVWYAIVWHAIVWYAIVRYAILWYAIVWYAIVWHAIVWYAWR